MKNDESRVDYSQYDRPLATAPANELVPAKCGASSEHLVCDREAGHQGQHRGYDAQIDEPMFWGIR
jgi:hypothetical protein